jgi:anti-sigma B factor antagonist
MSGLWIPALRIVGVAGGTTMVLTVAGEVDVANVAHLRRALADARAGFVTVILDLHNVWFFGAAGLKVVAAAHKHAPALGDFRLRDPSLAVRRVLDISGLDRVVPIEVTTAAPSPRRGAPEVTVAGSDASVRGTWPGTGGPAGCIRAGGRSGGGGVTAGFDRSSIGSEHYV